MIDRITSALPSTSVHGINGRSVEPSGDADNFFSTMLGALSEARSSIEVAEATSIAGLRGEATTQQVVETTLAAQRSLAEVTAIRNKIVEAYLDVSRMQI